METKTIERPALGRSAKIGAFYDATRDVFVDGNFFINRKLPDHRLSFSRAPFFTKDYAFSTTLQERLRALNVDGEVSLSFLSGMVTVGSTAAYLNEGRRDANTVCCVVYPHLDSEVESIDFSQSGVAKYVDPFSHPPTATHVVVGIKQGCNAFLELQCKASANVSETEAKEYLDTALKQFFNGDGRPTFSAEIQQAFQEIQLKSHADGCPVETIVLTSIEEAMKAIRCFRRLMAESSESMGHPLTYVLMEVWQLSRILNLTAEWGNIFHNLRDKDLQRVEKMLFDGSYQLIRMEEMAHRVHRYEKFISQERVESVDDRLERCRMVLEDSKKELSNVIPKLRMDPMDMDLFVELGIVLKTSENSVLAEKSVSEYFRLNEDLFKFMYFLEKMTQMNVKFVATSEEYMEMKRLRRTTTHVLFYSLDALSDIQWEKTVGCFLSLCEAEDSLCAAVGADLHSKIAVDQKIGEIPKIVSMTDNAYTTKDFVAEMDRWKSMNFAYCEVRRENHTMDSLKLVMAKIPCPNVDCGRDGNQRLQWHCPHCLDILEYDMNGFFYCGCGCQHVSKFRFKCCSENHGNEYSQYGERELAKELSKLQPYKTINILVIGETGVGKTTWINSLPSYIAHETLKDAEAEKLHYMIPFNFDRDVPDKNGMKNTKIIYGETGSCITEETTSYYFKHNGTIYRIVDSPGVGDVRGIRQDKRNIQNIISYTRFIDKLHLICFLLKPNQSRLDERFLFCFNELIMQFHRSAIRNIAFCFTQAAGVNFQVGQTSTNLQKILKQIKEKQNITIPMNERNVFIFDNIGFLHIAATHKGIVPTEDQIYLANHSFNVSRKATLRMMEHAQNTMPHVTEDTQRINFARNVIWKLAGPLTMIGTAVKKTIGEMRERETMMNKLMGDEKELLKFLRKTITVYHYRMVCNQFILCKTCSELREETEENRLKFIEADPTLADRNPLFMWYGDEVKQGENCKKCGPDFPKVVRDRYFTTEYEKREEEDVNVKRDIDNKAERRKEIEERLKSDRQLKMEYEDEHRKITNGSVRFGAFLKSNSIVQYNDITETYLETLMDVEMRQYGPSQKYQILSQMLGEYKKEKEQLEACLRQSTTTEDVSADSVLRLVEELRNLKHYGKDVRRALEALSVSSTEETIENTPTQTFVPTSKMSTAARFTKYLWKTIGF